MGHSEESRLANLLRRVSREDDRDRRLATLRQLKEFISHSESKVVSLITLLLFSNMFNLFLLVTMPLELRQQFERFVKFRQGRKV